jgi:hypothetical protein
MRRERARIEFPYGDLFDAVDVANKVHGIGEGCSTEQLATRFGETLNSPKFRLRMSTARIFGLVVNRRGRLHLTDLGRRMVEPETEPRALVDAFLGVELYGALYQRYKDQPLPLKQTDKARQAFERSAKQAKFLRRDRTQFARPVLPRPLTAVTPSPAEAPSSTKKVPDSAQGGVHLMVQGLLKELPEVGTEWPVPDRVKWLRAAAQIFSLAYKGEDVVIDVAIRATEGLDPARSEREVINGQDFCTDTTTGADQEAWEEYCAFMQNEESLLAREDLNERRSHEQAVQDQPSSTEAGPRGSLPVRPRPLTAPAATEGEDAEAESSKLA